MRKPERVLARRPGPEERRHGADRPGVAFVTSTAPALRWLLRLREGKSRREWATGRKAVCCRSYGGVRLGQGGGRC
jgi:hypothetical protein